MYIERKWKSVDSKDPRVQKVYQDSLIPLQIYCLLSKQYEIYINSDIAIGRKYLPHGKDLR